MVTTLALMQDFKPITAPFVRNVVLFIFQIDLNFSSTFIRRRVPKITRWCLVQSGNWRAHNQGRCGVLWLLG